MPQNAIIRRARRSAKSVTAALGLAASLSVAPAAAQHVIARVNGEPITAVDLAQRTRLLTVSGASKHASRKEVLNELIEQKLKMQAAQRYRVEISDAEVDRVVANMATRMHTDVKGFAKALSSAGISLNALKRKLRADLAWNNLVRGKFQASLRIREKDVADAVLARNDGKEAVSYIYSLRPILFVVPRGSPDRLVAARRHEAEGLRTRFRNCEDGLRLANGLRDVVIREPIRRTSGDLNAKLRAIIDSIPVGRLTPPDVTPSGVEVFAVCEKKTSDNAAAGLDRDVRQKMFGKRFEAKGKQYMQQLRRAAMIEIR